ncbi:MAG: 3-phosphoshikimate 1-carboxyvinyltransferase [Chloroflexota bacterium]
MNIIEIIPISHPHRSSVTIPGSKSLTNRAMLISALAEGQTKITNALFSDDSRYFATALNQLGFDMLLDDQENSITITGKGGIIPSENADLFIGNAGTAARFLSAFLTLGSGEFTLDGDPRMRERPLGDLIKSLTQLGSNVKSMDYPGKTGKNDQCPPVKIISTGLPGGETTVAGDVSSQFLSALLMVAPYAKTKVEIRVSTELNSKPYVDMTLGVMSDFGIDIERDEYRYFNIGAGRYKTSGLYNIEPDASAASYFFAAAAILGESIRVNDINKNSRQGDIGFVEVLRKMGCSVLENEKFIEVKGPNSGQLLGIDIDMKDIPDTAQTLAAIAPFASTPTHIHGIASARVKESDRVSATCNELTRMGVKVEERLDGMSIFPCSKIQPASIETYNDHRMAMSFALIGLRIPGVSIKNPECVAKTFPKYFQVLESLR